MTRRLGDIQTFFHNLTIPRNDLGLIGHRSSGAVHLKGEASGYRAGHLLAIPVIGIDPTAAASFEKDVLVPDSRVAPLSAVEAPGVEL